MKSKMGRKIKQKILKYKTKKHTYDFQQYKTIRSFGESIYITKIKINKAEMDQRNLLERMVKFNNKYRLNSKEDKENYTYKSAYAFSKWQQLTLIAFKSEIFQIKEIQNKGLKILLPTQMLQRLSIALIQVKSDNTSESFLNQIRQIIYSLYRAKKTTKEVYTNIMNPIKL